MKKYKIEALEALKGNWKVVLKILFIGFLIKIALIDYNQFFDTYDQIKDILDSTTATVDPVESSGYNYKQLIGYALLPLQIGMIKVYSDIANNKVTKVSDYFYGFTQKRYFENLGILLLRGIFVLLWSLLLIIPGIVKTYAYSMTEYIIQDSDFKEIGLDAITKSKNITNGYKLELFILDLSFIGWYLLSIFTFGLLLIYVIPYHIQTRVVYYKKIKEDYFNNIDNNETIEEPVVETNEDWAKGSAYEL